MSGKELFRFTTIDAWQRGIQSSMPKRETYAYTYRGFHMTAPSGVELKTDEAARSALMVFIA